MQIWPWCMNDPNAAAEAALAQVRARQHDQRVVAAEFEVGALEQAAGGLADLPARPPSNP